MIDCARSLALLSDYHDGALDERERSLVGDHLAGCPPCMGVFQDLELIVMSATVIRDEEGIQYPDENAVWARMRITGATFH